jgi:phosphoribosylanthranilate isomerase
MSSIIGSRIFRNLKSCSKVQHRFFYDATRVHCRDTLSQSQSQSLSLSQSLSQSIHTRVKVCCILSAKEARLAVSEGAHALGLVAPMPSGPGCISESEIGKIVKIVPPAVSTFLLTPKTHVDEIVAQWKLCKTDTIQLVDHCDPSDNVYAHLRRELPAIKLVQVVHVQETDAEGALKYALDVAKLRSAPDALLLDSGKLSSATDPDAKELGGTGRTHDWHVSAEIRRAVPLPLFLAGGLDPHNVQEAIKRVQPFGVDLCSGVRDRDNKYQLNADKLRKFMRAVQAASL